MAEAELPADLLVLMREFSRSGLRELQIRKGDFELYLSNDAMAAGPIPGARTAAPAASPMPAAAPAPAPAPSSLGNLADLPQDAIILRAPNLGTFYRSPKPGAPSYVEVGALVAEGDELCLIEVMKLFTAVRAIAPSRIHAVLVEDGAMVEAGRPLFAVLPLSAGVAA